MGALILHLVRGRSGPWGGAFSVALVLVVVVRSLREGTMSRAWKRGADVAIVVGAVIFTALAIVNLVHRLRHYNPWDFPCFYVVAEAVARHLNFYDTQVLIRLQHELARTSGVPSVWLTEVGFWYLPPTALILWPLAALSYRLALLLHQLVQTGLLVGAAWLMHRRFPLAPGRAGIAMLALLLFAFPPVQTTIDSAQILFGCLFFLLAADELLERAPWASGACLAVAFCFKPLALVPMALWPVGRDRNGKVAALWAFGTLALFLVASGAVFGWRAFDEYWLNGPRARPPELTLDPVMQSMLSLLYRERGGIPAGSLVHLVEYPPFLIASVVLLAVTIVLFRLSPPAARRERSWLAISLAVLCYPNTHTSTLTLLVPVVLGFRARAQQNGWPAGWTLALFAVVYGLTGFLPLHAGWGALACWLSAAVLCVSARRAYGSDALGSRPSVSGRPALRAASRATFVRLSAARLASFTCQSTTWFRVQSSAGAVPGRNGTRIT